MFVTLKPWYLEVNIWQNNLLDSTDYPIEISITEQSRIPAKYLVCDYHDIGIGLLTAS